MLLAQNVEDDLSRVRALERKRIDATRANDAEALAPLLHDSLIYVNSVGQIYDKQSYLREIGTNSLSYEVDFNVRETEVRALDNLIVLAGVMLGHARLEGEQQVFHFRSLSVWRKDDGEWRMLAWQSSSGSPG
jgi:ketosteroid isomerase-like protein